jgi:ribokinase
VSFDPGRRLGTRPYDDLVRQVDLLFVNEREASEIADTLTDRARPTVIKRGDGGALFRDGAETVSHDGFAVTPRDTAGAGDAFAAGFLATRLRDRPVTEALATANACGALAVESAGARAELSWTEVDCYRSRH